MNSFSSTFIIIDYNLLLHIYSLKMLTIMSKKNTCESNQFTCKVLTIKYVTYVNS